MQLLLALFLRLPGQEEFGEVVWLPLKILEDSIISAIHAIGRLSERRAPLKGVRVDVCRDKMSSRSGLIRHSGSYGAFHLSNVG